MKNITTQAVLAGIALAMLSLSASTSNADGRRCPPRRTCEWVVKYKIKHTVATPWRSKEFFWLNKSGALRFQGRMQRAGYQTKYSKVGLDHRVSYRKVTSHYHWRQRRFTGCNARRNAQCYRDSLRRRGIYTTMFRVCR